MNEYTAWTTIVFFACCAFAFMVFAIWQNSVNNTINDTARMTACVEQDKDWLFVDDANTFQCVGGR